MGDKLTGDQVRLPVTLTVATIASHMLAAWNAIRAPPPLRTSCRRAHVVRVAAVCSRLLRRVVQVEEMLKDVPVDANGNFKYQEFVKQFRSDA